jgi:two-component system, cell cycle response regulator DivK
MRFDQMQRTSKPTSRRPVVLLVQPSRDDGLEMYTEFLRYHGLAVILDDLDGVELVSRLRRDDCTRSTHIIVLTACAWPTDRERAEGAGCDVFLPKPCLPNDLLGEVPGRRGGGVFRDHGITG